MLIDRFGADCLAQLSNPCIAFTLLGLLPTLGHFAVPGQEGLSTGCAGMGCPSNFNFQPLSTDWRRPASAEGPPNAGGRL